MVINKKDTNILVVKIADNITAMLSNWDKDLICRFANSAFLDWFDKTQDEMIHKITLSELLGQSLFEKNLHHVSGVLNGDIQTFQREITLPSGKVRHALTSYHPDKLNGDVIGFFVHVADVTQLKLLEIELISLNEKINEQNKRLLNFSNIVSHNLKSYSNNLSSILNLFSAADSEDEKNKMFGFLLRISDGFSSTVNHLSEIVKSQNLAKIIPVRINLNEYLEVAKEILLVQIESTNAVIKNNVDSKIEILANPAYIESILLNLLTNAIKYKQPDKPPIIELTCIEEAGKVMLKIKDNGIGINMEKYGDDLFGMYKTFHGNSDAEGIGLFITKYQIETIGGQIEVDSKENVGTTFTITFNIYPFVEAGS